MVDASMQHSYQKIYAHWEHPSATQHSTTSLNQREDSTPSKSLRRESPANDKPCGFHLENMPHFMQLKKVRAHFINKRAQYEPSC